MDLKEVEIEDCLKLLSDFIISKIKNSEIVDINNYDSSIEIIKNEIIKHNNIIHEKTWMDEKYYKDKNIFIEKLVYYQNSIKIYENESYIKFI
jgi:hypothetical protein